MSRLGTVDGRVFSRFGVNDRARVPKCRCFVKNECTRVRKNFCMETPVSKVKTILYRTFSACSDGSQ